MVEINDNNIVVDIILNSRFKVLGRVPLVKNNSSSCRWAYAGLSGPLVRIFARRKKIHTKKCHFYIKIGSKNYLIIIFQAQIWNGESLHCIFKVLRLSYPNKLICFQNTNIHNILKCQYINMSNLKYVNMAKSQNV